MIKKIERIGNKRETFELPDFLMVQLESYKNFLQEDVPPEKRTDESLHGLFKEVFPIEDLQGKYTLEYIGYRVGKPRYTPEEALEKNLTYSVPLWVTIKLIKKRPQTGFAEEEIEQEVYFAEIPYMTPRGTFIISGVERVVLNQIHRSPGVYFSIDEKETTLYTALLVPYRGPWIKFTIDGSKTLGMTISRRRKIPLSRFLRVLGYHDYRSMIQEFLNPEVRDIDDPELRTGTWILADDVVSEETGELIFQLVTEKGEFVRRELTEKLINEFKNYGVKKVTVLNAQDPAVEVLISTFRQDRIRDNDKAFINIYRTLRYTPPRDLEEATRYIHDFFFSPERLFMSQVGRYKLNIRLRHKDYGIEPPSEDTYNLTKEDIVVLVKRLLDLYRGKEEEDDVDDLSNRRVRRVGERLYEHFRNSFIRTSRAIKEKLLLNGEGVTPRRLFNPRLLTASINNFFTTDSLSQLLDQTNPLSELTHKRRVSALGKGGLTRETASLEVRDVHPSHYGRLCPIETPEGQNIGLVLSLTTYAKIDDFGFIRTPLKKVKKGKVTDKVEYVAPHEEIDYKIAGGDTKVDEEGNIIEKRVLIRHNRTYRIASPKEVTHMDASPRQMVSLSASLIPFLEHDDANRALMGSNMQRQAVPLLLPEPPIVGTGMEEKVAYDSGNVVIARRSGTVAYVDSRRIVVIPDEKEGDFFGRDEYILTKFKRSNQSTIVHQIPVVKPGDKVEKGQILAEGSSIKDGELALGKNVLVAFVPWYGYNFEDAIVVSERVWKDDVYTSIHIDDYEVEVRETKLGPERITRDLPRETEETLKNLDEYGIVRIGAEVKPHDILVGKIAPESEKELSPEEKLIYAIFGEKARNYRNTSKRVPPGVRGTVINVVILTKPDENNELARKVINERREEAERKKREGIESVRSRLLQLLTDLLKGIKFKKDITDKEGRVVFKAGETFDPSRVRNPFELEFPSGFAGKKTVEKRVREYVNQARAFINQIEEAYNLEIDRIMRGDELPSGVIQVVRVYIAQKRKFIVGDKMAGRHGNKGVVSIVAPIQDMPFLDDGTPVDIVLNPLGVPSRMNVGQILETILGYAGVELTKKLRELVKEGSVRKVRKFLKELYRPHKDKEFLNWLDKAKGTEIMAYARQLAEKGIKYANPVFESMSLDDIKEQLRLAGLPEDGKVWVRDGRTGEYFDYPVTVGYMYMLKLVHMVEDKIHARSVGKYSIITQQPLGGRAHFGGQRFGEMEVWAAEAHGAAYALQEMLTVKSDDVLGRNALYRSIIKGDLPPEPHLPESFQVLVKNLRGLAIDVEIGVKSRKNDKKEAAE